MRSSERTTRNPENTSERGIFRCSKKINLKEITISTFNSQATTTAHPSYNSTADDVEKDHTPLNFAQPKML